jgi:hypothetical protein
MCDPVTIGLGLVAGAAVNQAEQTRRAASQQRSAQRETLDAAEGERTRAEAEAAQNANARLVESQRRRRAQNNLLARGATSPAAAPTAGDGVLTTQPVSRSTTARQSSLMARGAPSASFYG